MSLINHPGSDHQMAVIGIDAGHARDIMLMLTDAHALISDLADDPGDQQALQNSVISLEQDNYPLEIVALHPTYNNATYFKNLLGNQAIYQTAALPTGAQSRGKVEVTSGFSTRLMLIAVLLVGLLAVNEWWAEPFRFRRRPA